MVSVGEQRFHMLMGAMVLGSLFLDSVMNSVLPAWNPPQIGLVTFVLGLVWVGLLAGYRMRNVAEETRVLTDRIERAERKIEVLDRELAERNPPLPGRQGR